MKLVIHNKHQSSIQGAAFARILKKASALLKLEDTELSLAFLSQSEMRRINKIYRGVDAPTDVLSFEYGEILLCTEYIKKKYGITMKKDYTERLKLLFAHGILHIAGYDHVKKQDEEIMRELEEILVKC